MLQDDPAPRIIAACAPGCRAAAELQLAAMGEHYDELIESAILEGTTQVVVMQEPHWRELSRPLEFEFSGPPRQDSMWRDYLLAASVLQPSSLVIVGSV